MCRPRIQQNQGANANESERVARLNSTCQVMLSARDESRGTCNACRQDARCGSSHEVQASRGQVGWVSGAEGVCMCMDSDQINESFPKELAPILMACDRYYYYYTIPCTLHS